MTHKTTHYYVEGSTLTWKCYTPPLRVINMTLETINYLPNMLNLLRKSGPPRKTIDQRNTRRMESTVPHRH